MWKPILSTKVLKSCSWEGKYTSNKVRKRKKNNQYALFGAAERNTAYVFSPFLQLKISCPSSANSDVGAMHGSRTWVVVGGSSTGGILVRIGKVFTFPGVKTKKNYRKLTLGTNY